MNAEPNPPKTEMPERRAAADGLPVSGSAAKPVAASRPAARSLVLAVGVLALTALLLCGLIWQNLSLVQEQVGRQSTDASTSAIEARAVARQTQEQVREAVARQAAMEGRLNEVALQRSQLEELMQSLSRSRDENLVADIESAIRLAQQQAQLTGSVEPLLAALKSAEQRLTRAAQPRLTPLQRAIARDLGRIKGATVSDTPTLLVRLDEVAQLADQLPLANAVAKATPPVSLQPRRDEGVVTWWQRSLQAVMDEMHGLIRISRIDHPEAALLSPEQSFYLRENFRLRLLNARLGLLARQLDASRADLGAAAAMLQKYFDASSRKTQLAASALQQMQVQMKTLELPRVDETLAALVTAAAGR